MMKKLMMLLVVLGVIVTFSGTVLAESDVTSVNFYAYGKGGAEYWDQIDWRETLWLEGQGLTAGVGDWATTSWVDYAVPWAPTSPQSPITLTSSGGSTSTFTFNDCRNGAPYHWAAKRTTLLGDGNGNLMDGHVNATYDPGDGSNIFDITVSDITLDTYDVIIYLGPNEGQYGAGVGKIVFNGGAELEFQLPPNVEFSAFDEIDSDGDTGNYIVYRGVTGTSFTVRVWGNNADHIGPTGFQFGVTDLNDPSVSAGSDWITWSGEPATLNDVLVTNNDPGAGDLTLTWSEEPVAGVTVGFSDIHAQYPTVTITKAAPDDTATVVTLTLTVTQAGKEPVESSMMIDVYDDACRAALGAGTATIKPADFNTNCVTDLEDLAQVATDWLVDFSLTEPVDK